MSIDIRSVIGTTLIFIGSAYLLFMLTQIFGRTSFYAVAIFGGLFKPSVFIVAGMLMKMISKKDNFMNNQEGHIKSSLLISFFAIYFTAVGVVWSFLFFSIEPTIDAGYILALVYYFFGASIIISLVYFKFGKNNHQISEMDSFRNKAYWSDIIIKFLTFGMATLFVFGGFYLTLVSLARLERNYSMILVGILFFLSSLIVTVAMLYKVKKVKE